MVNRATRFPTLSEYLAGAKRHWEAFRRVGPVPPWEEYRRLAEEKWAVFANMSEEARDVSVAEERQEQVPALMAVKEETSKLIDKAKAGGKGAIVKHAKEVSKRWEAAGKRAKQIVKEQRNERK